MAKTATGERVTIAAAANLQFALPKIAAQFTAETGIKLNLVFGSSGNFSRQIRQGAPFDLFMSADETYVQSLHADGLLEDAGLVYASGRIALASPTKTPTPGQGALPEPKNPLERVKRQLANAQIKRFAIANPIHAPYGVIARQALQHSGVWETLEPFLVYGENVAQAAQFALSSNAQGGIIAYSLAQAPTLADKGIFYLIPANFHEPLLQRMVIVDNTNDSANKFYRYMQSAQAIRILQDYGFDKPGPGLPE